jgi:CRP/FNR family transcriptional regulator, cyclic AMP receptor protein
MPRSQPVADLLDGASTEATVRTHPAFAESTAESIPQARTPATVSLLAVAPELAADLSAEAIQVAQQALIVPTVTIAPGPCDLWTSIGNADVVGPLFGLLLLDGLLVREVLLGGQAAARIYGPGDLLQLEQDRVGSLGTITVCSAPTDVTLALLDDRVVAGMRRWPRLFTRVCGQLMSQIDRAAEHQAISQLVRVEDRLLAMFWHLADRWGRVCADGVLVELALTHEALGRLIGARRSTVTLGLRALESEHFLERLRGGTWLLAPHSLQRLAVARSGTRRVHEPGSSRATVNHAGGAAVGGVLTPTPRT